MPSSKNRAPQATRRDRRRKRGTYQPKNRNEPRRTRSSRSANKRGSGVCKITQGKGRAHPKDDSTSSLQNPLYSSLCAHCVLCGQFPFSLLGSTDTGASPRQRSSGEAATIPGRPKTCDHRSLGKLGETATGKPRRGETSGSERINISSSPKHHCAPIAPAPSVYPPPFEQMRPWRQGQPHGRSTAG